MFGTSRLINSPQQGLHPRLEEVVLRHAANPFRRPIAAHSRTAFEQVRPYLEDGSRDVVLDSGCGTGVSSFALGRRYPQHWVIGVDRSAHRLARSGCRDTLRRDNVILLRAELSDLWTLCQPWRARIRHHFLWYPNPYPKPRQLMRRWHAHPAFPTLLALGGDLELRTNWDLYAAEFYRALQLHGFTPTSSVVLPQHPSSPFERKYLDSGHRLYQVRCLLDDVKTGHRPWQSGC